VNCGKEIVGATHVQETGQVIEEKTCEIVHYSLIEKNAMMRGFCEDSLLQKKQRKI